MGQQSSSLQCLVYGPSASAYQRVLLSTTHEFHDLLQGFPPKPTYWFASLQNLTETGEFLLFHLYKRIKRVIVTKPGPIASL